MYNIDFNICNMELNQNQQFPAKEARELYKIVWEKSPEVFLLVDPSLTIVHLNESFYFQFGLDPKQEIIGQSFLNYINEKFIEKLKADFDYVLENGELKDCEYQANRGVEFTYPVLISYRRVKFESSDQYRVLLLIKDNTKSKIDEKAMRMAKERAEVADKLKTSFLANMSHEIRTPINAVIGFADLLNDPDLLDEEKQEYINTIQVNGELLLKLINDIIDIAKIESGQLKIQKGEFTIDNFMDEIYLSTRNMLISYEKQNLILDKHIDSSLKGKIMVSDQYRLLQIINNLLTNAVKFTDEGRIDFGVRLLENNNPEFYVSDTGIGIAEENIDHIFERFGQVEEVLERNVSGTGLGLSITKSLVELLGGKIKVESELNKGSTFTFTIDSVSKEGGVTNGIKKDVSLAGKKILIVEDVESNYRLLNILLEKQGAETIWALTGNQGVAICKNSRDIDLVLMDINLPDIDGYTATGQIKQFRPNLPVVAQTAYAMSGERDRSLEFGCDDYLSKPIIPEKLFSTISNLIY